MICSHAWPLAALASRLPPSEAAQASIVAAETLYAHRDTRTERPIDWPSTRPPRAHPATASMGTVAAGLFDAAALHVGRAAPGEPEPELRSTMAPDDPLGATLPATGPIAKVDLEVDAFVLVDPERYAVGAEIARGGMGRILAARDRRLGRPVAIKELLIRSGALRARFEREAKITAKLQHPAIVNLLEAGAWPSGEPFYVMKLVTGKSLDRVIASASTLEARLALLPNVIAVADALAYAHAKRVIHRDLKPANVLVGEFGETVVIDWGLAKDLADTSAPEIAVGPYRTSATVPDETQEGSVLGTPAYMPAEQAEGNPVDERRRLLARRDALPRPRRCTAVHGRYRREDRRGAVAGPPT